MNLKLKAFMGAICLSFLHLAPSYADTGAGGSNGGAGVNRSGKLMSFYSAGLYVEPVEQTDIPYSPPQLDGFLKFVSNFKYWSFNDKAKLVKAAVPSPQHQYFRVKEDQFDQKTKDRLLAEFSRVTNQPTEGLELFAITDIEKKQTFLLPNFYKLEKPADQIAILFHENFWLISGNGTDYQTVVGAELAFQAVYEQPDNGPRIMDLISRYGDQSQRLEVAAKIDLDDGALKGLLDHGKIPLKALLGDTLSNCSQNCVTGMLGLNLLSLLQKYPNSVILRALLSKEQSGGIEISCDYHVTDMHLDTPIGWVFFPATHTYLDHYRLEEAIVEPDFRGHKKIHFASCKMDLTPGKIGTLLCADKDSAILEKSIKLSF